MVTELQSMPSASEWWVESVVPERESFGAYLFRLRKEKEAREGYEIRQKDVANAVGVGMTAVGRWESDSSRPEGDKVYALADYFEVPRDEFLARLSEELMHRQLGMQSLSAPGLRGPSLAVPDRPEVRAHLFVLRDLSWEQIAKATEAVRNMPELEAAAKDHEARPQRTKQARQDSA